MGSGSAAGGPKLLCLKPLTSSSSLKETFSGFGILDRWGFLFLRAPFPPHLLFTQGLHPCGCPLTHSTLVGGEEVGAGWEAVLCRGGRGTGVPGGTSVTFGPEQAICARAAPRLQRFSPSVGRWMQAPATEAKGRGFSARPRRPFAAHVLSGQGCPYSRGPRADFAVLLSRAPLPNAPLSASLAAATERGAFVGQEATMGGPSPHHPRRHPVHLLVPY